MILYQIPPDMVLKFALMSPLSVPNFSLIEVRICILWQILQSVWKEVEKKLLKTEILAACISEMAGEIFFKLRM